MVSRRKILSRSRDELSTDLSNMDEEEDVWFQKDKLFKDHIQEVLNKWDQIDDEIWAKIICLERNRRVAKAYARAPVLTINGSDDGFDGYRIGLCGFDNPMRDAKTEEVKRHIGHGVKIKMDDGGNILVKRISKMNVFVKEVKSPEESSVSTEVIRLGGQLELDKPVKLFEMKKFQHNVSRELRKAYPDRRKLESQCISAVSFVKDGSDLLECPCWIMVINIVALDMLKSKLPPVSRRQNLAHVATVFDPSRLSSSDEDPYSLPSLTDQSASRSKKTERDTREPKPPKLPPRDFHRVPVPMPDYEVSKDEKIRKKQTGFPDDPYYCGLKARVPNFAKKPLERQEHLPVRKSHSAGYLSLIRPNSFPFDMARAVPDGMSSSGDDDHARIYGRLRPTTQNYNPGQLYVGDWE